MARKSFSVTVGTNLGQGRFSDTSKEVPDAVDTGASVSTTAVAAAIAQLVTDGASPTQAHVTTLNNAWTPLLASITAAKVSGAGDVVLSVDLANATTKNAIRSAIRTILRLIDSDGSVSE